MCLACGLFEDQKTSRHTGLYADCLIFNVLFGDVGAEPGWRSFSRSFLAADLNYVILKVPVHLLPTL